MGKNVKIFKVYVVPTTEEEQHCYEEFYDATSLILSDSFVLEVLTLKEMKKK